MKTRTLIIMGVMLLSAIACCPKKNAPEGSEQKVWTYSMNQICKEWDGQWQGIKVASDGNCYFASSTHSKSHGAGFHKFDMYGYNALIDYAKKTSRKKEPIADALERGEEVLKSKGIAPTPGQVLKYLSNEDAVENAVNKYETAGLTPQEAYEKAIQELTKQ